MSKTQRFFLAALAGAALFTPAATAGSSTKPELFDGFGDGPMVFPMPDCTGRLDARLVDEKGATRFTLDAHLGGFLPSCGFGWSGGGAQGGVYGFLREAPVGGAALGQPFAVVEGTWRLDADDTGVLDLHAYERTEKGTWRKVGALSGEFVSTVLYAQPPDASIVDAQMKKKQAALGAVAKPSVSSTTGGGSGSTSALAQALTAKKKAASTAFAGGGAQGASSSGPLAQVGTPWKLGVETPSPAGTPGVTTLQPPAAFAGLGILETPYKLGVESASATGGVGQAFVALGGDAPLDSVRVGRCKLRYVILH
ncbi:MAG: hypothetical protein H6828_03475 [Planctomycetes bacterium]|nr:hypothetical protein [Planctomycetota bacterium]